ncbi:MAG: prohibitin family protein [Dehalococcoidia bacterium]|nr:prohibitin family protein [Dehalococcoidia bacterium]
MKKQTKLIISGVVAFLLMLVLMMSIRIVRAGQRGVLLRWGAVQETVLPEGLCFICPIKNAVVKIDVRTQKLEVKAPAFSKDLQTADAIIALNYHLAPAEASKLWQEIGCDYQSRVIEPAIQEVVKAVTAKFNAQMLIEQRAEVKKDMADLLSTRLAKRYIVVDDVSVVNFDFSDDYEKAIERKQVAQQEVLTADNVLKQRKIEADQRIATATGEAEAIRIQAEAISKQGGDAYIKVRAIDKWDGKMPQILTSEGGGLLFNIPTQGATK